MNYKGYKPKSNKKNLRNTIDLANVVYDEEFVSLINSLSKTIKIYYTLTLNIIRDLYNNSLVIDNNSIYSKCLINEINYNTKEKIRQLEEKIETISNTKKIFEKNILLVHSNLNKFFNDSKEIFQNLKNIRNSKINFAIDSKKYEKHGINNSMINFRSPFEKDEQFTDSNENEKYYKNIRNSLNSEKPLSDIHYKRNELFHMKGNSTEINKKNRLKSIYFNHDLTNNIFNYRSKNPSGIKNKLFNNITTKKLSYDKNINYRQKKKNINIGNLNNIFEFTPEISKSKSSYNNFYINQNSNINLNSNNINNINNNNLELSYKVIEFLSLLSNISKCKSKNNPNFDKMIQNFENTKKNLFELSKNYIEQSNAHENKIYNNNLYNNFKNERLANNNMSRKEMKLLLMNNNIENITKGIEYQELIDKIKYLSNNINKLQKQNKQLLLINNNTKKELMNNNLILSKKTNQLNLIQKEKSQYISQINVLKKDNEALMELIQEKNNKELNNEEKSNLDNLNYIKQKEKIINDLNKKINGFENKISEKDKETNILNNKIKELNDSLKLYIKKIKEKENVISRLQIENKNIINNNNMIKQQDIKNSNKFTDLIFEKSEEIVLISNIKSNNYLLNIEQVISFSFSLKNIKKDKTNLNKEEIEKFKNKISELNSIIETKENEIKKYKNENSILKSFTMNKKKHEKEENDEDEDSKQLLEQEVKKLKKEKQNITDEKNNLEINFKKLISDNKNITLELDTKNIEIKKLENNVKELEDQIKEIQMKNIQKIYDEQNYIDNKKEKENESRNKKITNLLQADSDINIEIINQLKEEIKEKENEIEYLKIELQEFKSKAEENEDDNYDSMKNSETNEKNSPALEEKIKFLTERNEYYQKLYNEDKIKLQNLENINISLKNEIEELKNSKNIEKNKENNPINLVEKNENKIFSLKEYDILCNKNYGNLIWYLLANKSDPSIKEKENYDYNNLFWVPKINISDIDNYNEIEKENEIKNDDKLEKPSTKIHKNEISKNKEKEINFFNNFSFNNNSEELNKNKQNSNNNSNSIKPGSAFSLGNINIINEENNNNDYNKLFEKYKLLLEKLSKIEESSMKLKKKNIELIGKIKKLNKNHDNLKASFSEESNKSNPNDLGKLSIVDSNFEGEGDIINKLNSKNEREQEYFESINLELEATKNQLKVVKEVFKEMEKKFETVKKICENFFSRITLKKKEKEEIKVLLKVMEFKDEQIALIIKKKKK